MLTLVVCGGFALAGFLAGVLTLAVFVTSSNADEEAERW